MSKSKSSSSQSSSSTNFGFENVDNATALNGNDNTVIVQSLDSGTVVEALDFARGVTSDTLAGNEKSLSTVESVVESVFDFGAGTIDSASDSLSQAYGFGSQALDSVHDISSEAISEINTANENALEFASENYAVLGAQLNDTFESLSNTTHAIASASASESEKLTSGLFDTVQKVALFGAIGLAAYGVFK